MTHEFANPLRNKLAGSEAAFGIWSIIPSPTVAEIIGRAGMDFQILDMEHGFFNLPALESSIRACEAADCVPLVRAPAQAPETIQSALDLGAHGIVIPQVTDAETARLGLRATRFPPQGHRGFNPFTRVAEYGAGSDSATARLSDDWVFKSVIIENVQAHAALDDIASIPGLDMIYLGVYDMSVDLGCAGDVNDPRIQEFLEQAIPRIRGHGKAVGVMVKDAEEMRRFLTLGANFLVYVVDSYVISQAMMHGVDTFRRLADSTKTAQ